MSDYVEQGEVKQIIVQRVDGSTWTAEITLDGKVQLLEMLKSPDREVSEEELEQEGFVESEESEESEDGEDSEDAEGEEDWGDGEQRLEEYSDSDIEKLIEQMSHRELRETDDKWKSNKYHHYKLPEDLLAELEDHAFRGRVSSIMRDNMYDRKTKGRTRGKLDMTRLYKVPAGSRSVFTQKQSRRGKAYNIVILVDTSGSMSGRKGILAAESTVFLVKELSKLNINVGVITFDDEVYVQKELTGKPNYPRIYEEIANPSGGNNDYQAMRRSYRMFDKAPEGRNVFLMLSDGNPTGHDDSNTYDIDGNVENMLPDMPSSFNDSRSAFHNLVRSYPEVASIGIGIEEGGWQVPDHEVIHDVEMLKRTIIKQLMRHIKRG